MSETPTQDTEIKTSYQTANPIKELEDRYSYHSPKGDQENRYVAIRKKAKELAYLIEDLCPNSREKSLAQTKLQESVQMANSAIAINE